MWKAIHYNIDTLLFTKANRLQTTCLTTINITALYTSHLLHRDCCYKCVSFLFILMHVHNGNDLHFKYKLFTESYT